jgi:Probable zinc-ribbon domain
MNEFNKSSARMSFNNKDIIITCSDCGEEFTWNEGEQAFYKKNNLIPPRRCYICRVIRRANKEISKEDNK